MMAFDNRGIGLVSSSMGKKVPFQVLQSLRAFCG